MTDLIVTDTGDKSRFLPVGGGVSIIGGWVALDLELGAVGAAAGQLGRLQPAVLVDALLEVGAFC